MLSENALKVIKEKYNSDDRRLVLKPIEGKYSARDSGLIGSNLVSGESVVHAIRNPMNNIWSFKYTAGTLPQPLRQQFTTFSNLLKFAEGYFNRRGIAR